MRVVILGSTGFAGGEILKKLIDNAAVESITTITRSKVEIDNEKIQQVVMPLDQWFSDANNFKDIDVAISSFGTTRAGAGGLENFKKIDYGTNLEFAKMCKEQSIPKFILVSTAMASPNSMLPYLRIKGELERDIRALNIPNMFFLRPGGIQGDRKLNSYHGNTEQFFLKLGLYWPVNYFLRCVKVESVSDCVNKLLVKEGTKVIEYKDLNDGNY
ncbi:protein Fmp52p, mitochondrial [[Candida] jaroonii]|uniref:Protein Fmp52p, mitochondrial n=1 Tax=[Candida] jaroonii TaxID=467808 RepID=A0ACA9Y7H6_9ASCO|nr:protein Fmp52p, mitochondrial [[Candida] jaroonii]